MHLAPFIVTDFSASGIHSFVLPEHDSQVRVDIAEQEYEYGVMFKSVSSRPSM